MSFYWSLVESTWRRRLCRWAGCPGTRCYQTGEEIMYYKLSLDYLNILQLRYEYDLCASIHVEGPSTPTKAVPLGTVAAAVASLTHQSACTRPVFLPCRTRRNLSRYSSCYPASKEGHGTPAGLCPIPPCYTWST